MSDDDQCGSLENQDTFLNLRIASVFIILVTSTFGSCFPLWAKNRRVIPQAVFQFAKYFGSGVIIATAFIHLLAPGFEALGSPCLSGVWAVYPWPAAISMTAVFFLFFAELIAFRWGTATLAKLGTNYDTHGHGHGYTAHGPEGAIDPTTLPTTEPKSSQSSDAESQAQPEAHHTHTHATQASSSPLAQIVAVIILEFGVIFHSAIIGLTLAVDEAFKALFIVIIFHQMFEGLGLGTRLAALKLPPSYRWSPLVGAIAYGLTTPIGIAIGLAVRTTYNPGSATASIISGVFDSFSSGILLYTGLVELLAHEFLFNKEMNEAPLGQVVYAAGCVVFGAGIMALLGRWA